jgi:hypothetical protein
VLHLVGFSTCFGVFVILCRLITYQFPETYILLQSVSIKILLFSGVTVFIGVTGFYVQDNET